MHPPPLGRERRGVLFKPLLTMRREATHAPDHPGPYSSVIRGRSHLVRPLRRPVLPDPRHHLVIRPHPPGRQGVQRLRERGAGHDLPGALPAHATQQLLHLCQPRQAHEPDRRDWAGDHRA